MKSQWMNDWLYTPPHMQVVVRMKQYKDDLLVSCLQLLLSLPNELVKPEFSNLVPALQVQPSQLVM